MRALTLAELEAKNAVSTGQVARNARGRARVLCAKLGCPVPGWAAERKPFGRTRYSEPLPDTVSVPVAIDALEALRAWRLEAPTDRAVAIKADEVVLTQWIDGRKHEARYLSAASALVAIARGTLAWRVPKPPPAKRTPGALANIPRA